MLTFLDQRTHENSKIFIALALIAIYASAFVWIGTNLKDTPPPTVIIILMAILLGFLPSVTYNIFDRAIKKWEADIVKKSRIQAVDDFVDYLYEKDDLIFLTDVMNKEVSIRDGEIKIYGTTTVGQSISDKARKFNNQQ